MGFEYVDGNLFRQVSDMLIYAMTSGMDPPQEYK